MAATRSYRDDRPVSPLRLQLAAQRRTLPGHSITYRCRLCHYRFTPDGNRHYYSEQIKEQAIDMYGEGMAIAAISRVLEVKLGTVYQWVKKSPVGPGDLGLGDHATPAVGHGSSHIF